MLENVIYLIDAFDIILRVEAIDIQTVLPD